MRGNKSIFFNAVIWTCIFDTLLLIFMQHNLFSHASEILMFLFGPLTGDEQTGVVDWLHQEAVG
jgi:hypothetical protein